VAVSADGRVTDAKVVESAGADLDAAALEAVKKWTFTPAKRGDQPIESFVRVPFRFALPAEEPKPPEKPPPEEPRPPEEPPEPEEEPPPDERPLPEPSSTVAPSDEKK